MTQTTAPAARIPSTFEVGARVHNARGAWVELQRGGHGFADHVWWAKAYAPDFANGAEFADLFSKYSCENRTKVEAAMRRWLRTR